MKLALVLEECISCRVCQRCNHENVRGCFYKTAASTGMKMVSWQKYHLHLQNYLSHFKTHQHNFVLHWQRGKLYSYKNNLFTHIQTFFYQFNVFNADMNGDIGRIVSWLIVCEREKLTSKIFDSEILDLHLFLWWFEGEIVFCHRNIVIFCTEDLNHLWIKDNLLKVDQL